MPRKVKTEQVIDNEPVDEKKKVVKQKVKKEKSVKQIEQEAKNKERFTRVINAAKKYSKENPDCKWTECVKKGWDEVKGGSIAPAKKSNKKEKQEDC